MTRMYVRGVAALAVVSALVGCSKDATEAAPKATSELPAEMAPHPAKGDGANVAMPAWFASVPQDTPYLVASLAPVSLDYYAKLKKAMAPLMSRMVTVVREQVGNDPLLEAIVREVDGKWSEAGLESLGFSAKPRFAVYGLGLLPAVLRVEVKDHKVLQATLERIAAAGGKSLPPTETKEGRNFWRLTKDDATAVIALADNQLIAAFGKTAEIDGKLGLILGIEKPAQGMSDGKALKDVMARHGFGPELVGYVDSKRVVTLALAAEGPALTPTCISEIDRLTSILPRLAVGCGELSAARVSTGFVLEAAPELRAKLEAVKAVVPGLRAALAAPSVMAIGTGFDLAAGQKLGGFVADNVQQLGTACALDSAFEEAGQVGRTFAKPLPGEVSKLRGGVLSMQQFELDAHGEPDVTKMAGFALISSTDSKALFAKALENTPELGQLGITVDGKLHDVDKSKMPLPADLAAGVADKVMVVTIGAGKAHGAKVLATDVASAGKAPLLVASYDYGKLLQWQTKLLVTKGQGGDDFADALRGIDNVFGRASLTVDVTDQGLAFWTTIELK